MGGFAVKCCRFANEPGTGVVAENEIIFAEGQHMCVSGYRHIYVLKTAAGKQFGLSSGMGGNFFLPQSAAYILTEKLLGRYGEKGGKTVQFSGNFRRRQGNCGSKHRCHLSMVAAGMAHSVGGGLRMGRAEDSVQLTDQGEIYAALFADGSAKPCSGQAGPDG